MKFIWPSQQYSQYSRGCHFKAKNKNCTVTSAHNGALSAQNIRLCIVGAKCPHSAYSLNLFAVQEGNFVTTPFLAETIL